MPTKVTKSEKRTFSPERWTIERAASEWDINPRTLAKRLKVSEIHAGSDGKFSTRQIDSAIHGDMDGQKLRETTHRANLLAIEEKEKCGDLIPRKNAVRLWSEVIALLREKVMSLSKLTEDDRRDILAGLRDIPPNEYFRDDRELADENETEAA